ncbi:MAG: hypothetical protein GY832_23690 [Chloroflexi bacterium]|nr:hypothetical protein [Chloroflexota bacterium]
MTRSLYMLPVEINDANNNFSINDGGGADPVVVPSGSYGNMLAVLWKVNKVLDGINNTISLSLDPDTLRVSIEITPGTFTITWDDDLQELLGFDGTEDVNGVASATGNKTVAKIWYPTRTISNLDWFTRDQSKTVRGTNTANGTYAGISTASTVRQMKMEFEHEPKVGIDKQFATDAMIAERSWDEFIYQARAANTTSGDNVSIKGFYFYPDASDATVVADVTTDSGVNFSYTTNPSTHIFCQLTGNQRTPRPSIGHSLDYLTASVNCLGPCLEPSWTVPS